MMENYTSKIDELSNKLNGLKPTNQEWQSKLDKKFRLEFNYNSNHMEGNTLTYSETELLLIFDQTKGNHSLRELEEMKAHDVAFQMIKEWAAEPERPLTETNVKNLNEVILVKPFWKEAITTDGQKTKRLIKVGDYKEYPNSVLLPNGEIFEYASVSDTPILMGELIEWFRTQEQYKELHVVELAASLHFKLVRIHPFDDGNGRLARLLMNYVLMKFHYPPVVIKSSDKQKYLSALHLADVGYLDSFISFIAEQLIWSLEITIKAAKGESIEEPEDLDKKLALLERELEAVDPNEEVKYRFDREVFTNIFHGWIADLIRVVVPEIQKANKFFTGTSHSIRLNNSLASVQFTNETPTKLIEKLEHQLMAVDRQFQEYEPQTIIYAQYGTLIKGGLKTFGCNYGIEIRFDMIKYQVYVDDFVDGSNQRKQTKMFERLLHKPLSEYEIKQVVKQLMTSIIDHIDYNTKKSGLR
jgi:Fic family protein